MWLLQLRGDPNGGLVHRQRKGNVTIILHVHWSGWSEIVAHAVVTSPKCAHSVCSSAGCSTATWCVWTMAETCWMLVSLPCWLPWRTVCAVNTVVATEFICFLITDILTLISLLPTAQLPEVTISTETCTPVVNLEKKHGLHIHKHPVGASFCVFDK